MKLSGYAFDRLRDDGEFVLYRAHATHVDPASVLLLTPTSSRPSPETLKKIDHEYSLSAELESAWAVRPLAISQYNARTALVLEDPGGRPLDVVRPGPMEMSQFLGCAVGLAIALSRLHERNLIHKDVKPTNVLLNPATGHVRLMGFGIASRLRREHQPAEFPELIAGTLPYMAPEQTGRMNRSIDSRSDLYALGVTLYELLTGNRPFTASDPMEWVHSHIARHAIPPHERVRDVPVSVSAIVMKLLAKTPEERYQTASGVESDLRRCLDEWNAHGRVGNFSVGQHDAPDHLLIPEKLYGRAREIEALLGAFERVIAGGAPELVLVSGYSGIGKSTVVNELHKRLLPSRGLFASGKFDQYKRNIPYATLAQAFQGLTRQLLNKSEDELSIWRAALQEALDPNGQLIVSLVPELKAVIGEQPPVPILPPQDAQRRFHLVFRRFLSVFACPEHPLALFLDDLQWLDAATLDLMEDLLTRQDSRHFLLIGAYRDNEVDVPHPLMRKLEEMRHAGVLMEDIVLAPLRREDLDQLVAESLRCDPRDARPLAELVHNKTSGNPFFAIQFLVALFEEGLLALDHVEGRWSWDLRAIRAKGYADNVVDLMIGKLARFRPETQDAMKQLACLGNSAEFTMLDLVYQDTVPQIHSQLTEAIGSGLIAQSQHGYRFLHDRVQEAAYSLIPQELIAEAHLRIGRLMEAHTPQGEIEERVFEIVNQFNLGSHLITSTEERERLAELNLIAGRRAKDSTAYASALRYLRAGRELLTDESWDRSHGLVFALECLLAECELLTTEPAAAEIRLTMLAGRAASTHEIALVTRLRVTLYTATDRSDRAVEVFLAYWRDRGTVWSAHPTENEVLHEYGQVWSLLGDRQIEELVDSPLVIDPDVLDDLEVLTEVVAPALFTDGRLLALLTCRMVVLSLKHGNSDGACYAYIWLGVVAGPQLGNYGAGFRFGKLAYDLVDMRGLRRYQNRTYAMFAGLITPWTSHVKTGLEVVRRTFTELNRIGDLNSAAYDLTVLHTNLLVTGDPLADVQREVEAGLEFATKIRFGHVMDCIEGQLRLIRTLRGLTASFGSFNDEHFDELRFENRLASTPSLAMPECWYWIRKLQARLLSGDHDAAIDASLRAERLLWTSPSFLEVAEYHFYSALARAAAIESATSDSRQRHVEAIAGHLRQLEIWADSCPENFENRAALVRAEVARLEGHVLEAERCYEEAIRSAHDNGFVNNEAIAYELAARFYAARGFHTFADAYLLESRYRYQRWGADGKVAQLDRRHPQLQKSASPSAPGTILARAELLDLATVMKVSQAVSGEMVLDKLIERLMRAAVEHAGAERGLLILLQGDSLLIEAEASTGVSGVTVHRRDAAATSAVLPESVIRYVMRTRDDVILDDASVGSPFAADPYVLRHRVRSVLSLPLINQGQLKGALYLENNLAARVFTPDRITILKLLAAQAAISLENSRLYRDVRRSEAFLAEGQALSQTGSFGWNTATGELFWSRETYRIFGVAPEVAPTLSMIVDVIHPDDRARFEYEADTFARERADFEHEYRLKLRDGSIRHVHAVGRFSVRGFPGLDFIGAIMDVTERKRAADALLKAQAGLADVTRLTTMGELAASIAHEINQPLATVVTNAQTCVRLLHAQPPHWADVANAVSDIAEAGKRASAVIARIRLLLRKGVAEPVELSVNDVIRDVVALTRGTTQANGVLLDTRLTHEMPPVLADHVQLQQVLINLITNATQAMSEISDRPRVLTISSTANDGAQVQVSVMDVGIGIDPAHRDRIFDPFFTTKADGMGMGLAICRGIVEAFGGRLWATSSLGVGTTVCFALPAAGIHD